MQNNVIYWRCNQIKAQHRCPARLITGQNGITEINTHNHDISIKRLLEEEYVVTQ